MHILEQRVVATHFLTPSHKIAGFSLLEILLVLTVAAVIITMGINRYQQYRETLQISAIKSDIRVISAALDQYFDSTPCSNHEFPLTHRDPSMTDLGLSKNFSAREPMIIEYHTHIVESQTISFDHQPFYLLKIVATLNPNLTPSQLGWYQKLLNAGQLDIKTHELTWQTTPHHRFADAISAFSGLEGGCALFRKIQNGKDESLNNYCMQ